MGMMITMVILVIGGIFLWTKVIQPQMSGKYAGLAIEAQKEFDEKGKEMKAEAFSNMDKFGIFKTIVPNDEKIVAIASFIEPKGIGKNLLNEVKTVVTNVRKVNMCLFYFILTNKSLHAVAFNGENSVSHDIFDLSQISNIELEKAGSNYASSIKDALSGVENTGQLEKLKFIYKDQKYDYNLELVVEGFPIFKVEKDTVNETFYRVYKAYSDDDEVHSYKTKAFYLDSTFRSSLYEDFKKALGL